MGRGANFLLKDIAHALSIRVVAPLEERIKRIVRRGSLNREAALWMAKKIDHERSCFLYSIYGKHGEDPEEYDLVIHTGSRPLDEDASMVRALVDGKERLKTEESQRLLAMRAAAARVSAGLATDRNFFIPALQVESDGQAIVLRGEVENVKEHKRVEDAAHRLAADLPLRSGLRYRG
jgi:hypothetical protein